MWVILNLMLLSDEQLSQMTIFHSKWRAAKHRFQPVGGWALPQACGDPDPNGHEGPFCFFALSVFQEVYIRSKCIRDLEINSGNLCAWMISFNDQSINLLGAVSSLWEIRGLFGVFEACGKIAVCFINPCLFAGWWRGWGGFWPTPGGCGGVGGKTVMSQRFLEFNSFHDSSGLVACLNGVKVLFCT